MKVRYPTIDLSEFNPHWTKVPEFAQFLNAFSTVPAHIEPFLVKVMTKAKAQLGPEHEQLKQDIEIFNKQEVQHCRNHLAYNKHLYQIGYPEMEALEKPYQQDYERFLSEKSLRFNVAYCEGFEALGSASAQVHFEDLAEFYEGAEEAPMNLWKWHLAEEFEHRSVTANVYKALYGNSPFAYAYRVWAFVYAVKHIGRHTAKIARYLIDKDREKMNPVEIKASVQREKEVNRKNASAARKRLRAVFSPFYDPGRKQMSPGMAEILAAYPDQRP